MKNDTYTFHHIAISVRNLSTSLVFYEKLGFREVHRWGADDGSLIIVHLKLGGVVLEVFAYAQNAQATQPQLEVANNLEVVGVKHFGLQVRNVHVKFDEMKQAGYEVNSPEVKAGRTDIDYFFIKDPDGMWVEIVQDKRGY